MENNTIARPLVLVAASPAHSLSITRALSSDRFAVVEVRTSAAGLAMDWAHRVGPDAIVLSTELPDMSAVEACRAFRRDPRIGLNVPILILALDKPTAQQRVEALGAGAWDFLSRQTDNTSLAIKIEMYIQAKRNLDLALVEGLTTLAARLHTLPSFVRRARELGSLMTRRHGSLACIVFTAGDADDPTLGTIVTRTARISDVVGVVGPAEVAVLAAATEHAGAVRLANRIGAALGAERETLFAPGTSLLAGYEVAVNLRYSPMDPVDLIARASGAVRHGTSDRAYPWVRRFDAVTMGVSVSHVPPDIHVERRSVTR